MGAVKQAASDLVQMLKRRQREAKRLTAAIDRLESHLREEPKKIIRWSLFLLLSRVDGEATKRTRGVVVLISPEGMVTVGETGSVDSDSWLKRLKSQGFSILTLEQFGSFIRSLQLEVAQENYVSAIKFLRANAEFQRVPYPPSVRTANKPREPSHQNGRHPTSCLQGQNNGIFQG